MSVQSFISTTAGTLDSKGRVCIPAAYRQILAAQETPGVYVCPSLMPGALDAFGSELLARYHQQLAEQDPFFSTEFNDKAFLIVSRTHPLPLDENGRVRLPDEMIALAGLKDRVMFVGMSVKFQIWEPVRFQEMTAAVLKRAVPPGAAP